QDLDRAVVLGEESYGKGLVQQTKDLAYTSKPWNLTVAKHYTLSGRCIQRDWIILIVMKKPEQKVKADSLIKTFKRKTEEP
ncbi:MAG: peptidase S41, partial [Flavobacteriales bacterium]|nr:peptidase S41 [Flavobacteriales bacterium]